MHSRLSNKDGELGSDVCNYPLTVFFREIGQYPGGSKISLSHL